jgi:hypothetical protein
MPSLGVSLMRDRAFDIDLHTNANNLKLTLSYYAINWLLKLLEEYFLK